LMYAKLSEVIFPFEIFIATNYMSFSFISIHATCPVYFILFGLIALTVLDKVSLIWW
jgi:hypothetical protein